MEERHRIARDLLRELAPQVKSENHLVIQLVRILGASREENLLPLLGSLVGHPARFIREEAITQLGRILSAKAAPFLLQAMKDEDPTLREGARKALERLDTYLQVKRRWEERAK